MTHAELNKEIERLHNQGKRPEVVALMRKYGLFTGGGQEVRDYLAWKDPK